MAVSAYTYNVAVTGGNAKVAIEEITHMVPYPTASTGGNIYFRGGRYIACTNNTVYTNILADFVAFKAQKGATDVAVIDASAAAITHWAA